MTSMKGKCKYEHNFFLFKFISFISMHTSIQIAKEFFSQVPCRYFNFTMEVISGYMYLHVQQLLACETAKAPKCHEDFANLVWKDVRAKCRHAFGGFGSQDPGGISQPLWKSYQRGNKGTSTHRKMTSLMLSSYLIVKDDYEL